jgi:hypothetical protein
MVHSAVERYARNLYAINLKDEYQRMVKTSILVNFHYSKIFKNDETIT